ncbi:vacuolar basic amino acid transporter 2 [Histoplasma capsulatum G186AR]|uniref:Efflux pump dotC n=1 Tax=Ajellomyces capsulatus (strain G186AR / H82 / ATCC MYA-2454 / RMSCC 2432) TaxID=447093 RepID=C0NAS2_AJECG|nr:vacuolar basic amino acid transporter 2 [Histoplasma capsulatum G186AR]EEH10763.1 vacuolar basic amino acid transporter 2 [Histoplasma capsulatum G186AR]
MGVAGEDYTPDSPTTTQAGHSPIMEKEFDCEKPARIGMLDTNGSQTGVASLEQDDTGSDSPATPRTGGNDITTAVADDRPAQSEKMTKKQIAVVMFALCSIIATALPTIARQFNTSESGYSWMASSYLLGNASVIPLWGKLSDIWGRKPIIVVANVLFLLSSLMCALAPNTAILIAGRAIQGVGGGGLVLLGQICVGDLFSQRERPVYYAMFGMTWAIAGSLGPVVGGLFTEKVTWRWCFYINLPFGGLALVTLLIWLKIDTPKTSLIAGLSTIDWLGTILIIGGTLMFLFGLEFGGITLPWNSPTVICLLIFGAITLGLFVIIERKVAKYPILPMALFADRSNVFTLLLNWSHASNFIAGAFFLPLYFQTVLGTSPIMSGVYILPQVVSLSVVSFIVGFAIRKTGTYVEFIRLGMFVMTLGTGLYIDFKPYTSWPRLIIYQAIAGSGTGPNFQAPLLALQSRVPQSEVSTATSTHSFVRQLSTATSVVLGGVVYQNVLKQSAPRILAALGPELAKQFVGNFAGVRGESLAAITQAQRDVLLDVYNVAFSRVWIFYAAIGALGCVFSLFIKKKELSRDHEVTKTGLEAQEHARQARIMAKRERKEKKLQEKAENENMNGNGVMKETV